MFIWCLYFSRCAFLSFTLKRCAFVCAGCDKAFHYCFPYTAWRLQLCPASSIISLSACRYTFTSAYRKCTCSISQNLYWMSSQSNNVTIGNDIYAFKKKWLKMIESNCWNLVLTLFWPSLYAHAMLLIPGQHRYTCDWWECASNSVCVDRIKGPINVCENIQQKMLGII